MRDVHEEAHGGTDDLLDSIFEFCGRLADAAAEGPAASESAVKVFALMKWPSWSFVGTGLLTLGFLRFDTTCVKPSSSVMLKIAWMSPFCLSMMALIPVFLSGHSLDT